MNFKLNVAVEFIFILSVFARWHHCNAQKGNTREYGQNIDCIVSSKKMPGFGQNMRRGVFGSNGLIKIQKFRIDNS